VDDAEGARERRMTAADSPLKLPVMLGSLPLTMLPFLLPVYATQFKASALGIGGLFAMAQGMTLLCRPLIGWGVDRWGRRGLCLAGLAGYAGAMGVCALARSLTSLYLAQLLNGLATACTWTALYTLTADLAPAATQGEALGRVDEYAHRGALYGMGLALVLLSWWAQETALRVLFLSYMALAVLAVVVAWTWVPETRPALPPPAGRQPRAVWPLVPVLLLVLLSYLLTALLRPVFVVFLHDELTQDVRLLALAFVPAVVLESVLPSRLGSLSDRWGRRPLIIAGLTWVGLSCLCLSLYSALAWMIVWWTLKTLGLAAALPPQKAVISDRTAEATRGTGYGLYTFATSLGSTIGPLVGGWLYDRHGHTTPFVLTGLMLLASLGWVSLLLRGDSVGEAPPHGAPRAVSP
jgi:DHA1 family multidrug resistance protein-like MFS transporter